jgi:hypothetical protein
MVVSRLRLPVAVRAMRGRLAVTMASRLVEYAPAGLAESLLETPCFRGSRRSQPLPRGLCVAHGVSGSAPLGVFAGTATHGV